MFAFDPPEGAQGLRGHAARAGRARRSRCPRGGHGAIAPGDVRTFGTGFSTRVAVRLSGPLPEEASALLPYAGPLLSAIVVERGGDSWLLAGPVPVATLERDADRLP